jgi:Ca2+-binding EF-hand superfamily protein
MNRRTLLCGAAGLAAVSLGGRTAFAGQNDKPSDKNVAAGEIQAKQLLLLMDADKNGKVSRAEFMAFMSAEFDRLDIDHDGELDVKELTQFGIRHMSGHR